MPKPNKRYYWQVQLDDGQVISQFDSDSATERRWQEVNDLGLDRVVRVTLIDQLGQLPTHDVLIDHAAGQRLVKRFARAFMPQRAGFVLTEYIHCVATNTYRLWVFSDGRITITKPDYELRI